MTGRNDGSEGSEKKGPRPGVWGILVETIKAFLKDDVIHWGGSLAYYSLISLGPLVVLGLVVLGQVVGTGEAESWVVQQVESLSGPQGVEVVRTIIDEASRPQLGVGAILPILLFLFAATAVFTNLQGALNKIWGVQPTGGIVRNLVRARAGAFFMVLALGGLLIVLVISSAVVRWLAPFLDPLQAIFPWVQVVDLATSLLLLWLFVTAAFTLLPDVKISWRDVWVGALATAVLLVLGKFGLTAFLGRNAFASMYGAAGSILLLMMWVYYSSQVFLIGAEFTQVWARRRGREIRPEDHAVRTRTIQVTEEEAA